jgi:trehalose-6-phosphatase
MTQQGEKSARATQFFSGLLESALKIVQAFVQKQHSDSSSDWLFDARFILYGGNDIPDEKKSQCWAFKWMNDTKEPPTIYIVAQWMENRWKSRASSCQSVPTDKSCYRTLRIKLMGWSAADLWKL